MRTIAATATIILAALMLAGTSAAESPLERGTYLMESIAACPVCHTPWDEDGQIADKHFAGGLVFEEDEYTAYASNITPDVETGIGGWSDEEIIIAIREGKRPDGSLIGPAMPIALYRGMSDRDAQAIAAYLRSIPPIRNEVPASEYDIPLPADYGPPLGEVPEVAYYDLGAYGEYLAGPIANCIHCHTPIVDGWRDYENMLGAGGHEMEGPWGETSGAKHHAGLGYRPRPLEQPQDAHGDHQGAEARRRRARPADALRTLRHDGPPGPQRDPRLRPLAAPNRERHRLSASGLRQPQAGPPLARRAGAQSPADGAFAP